MKALGERSLASLIRFIVGAFWWLDIVTLALVGGLLVYSLCGNLQGKNLTMDLPVALELTTPVRSSDGLGQTDARIEQLQGDLQFPVRNRLLFSGSLFLIVLILAFVLWIVTQLRRIFRDLSRGLVFIPENARRIRWLGFTVIFGELAKGAIVYFWSYYTSLHFTAEGLRFVTSIDFSGMTIVAGLSILVVAEVFREGTRLREDQALTI
jgi:hypothetical protein